MVCTTLKDVYMINKLDDAAVQLKSLLVQEVKDSEFQIAHFSPVHYLGNLHLWPYNIINSMMKTPDAFNVFYVIEEKLSHVPFAVSDSKTELQIYADLNGMKLSECNEESLI